MRARIAALYCVLMFTLDLGLITDAGAAEGASATPADQEAPVLPKKPPPRRVLFLYLRAFDLVALGFILFNIAFNFLWI